jgi:hypothetical protein
MAVVKLFSRIVAPDLEDTTTYGITSDPWTQLALMLSALVHDVDHPGVRSVHLPHTMHEKVAKNLEYSSERCDKTRTAVVG